MAQSAHMRRTQEPEPQTTSAPAMPPLRAWELPVAAVVLFLSAWAVGIDAADAFLPAAAVRVTLFAAGLYCYRDVRTKSYGLTRAETVRLAIFTAVLCLVLLAGGHIHFSGNFHANQFQNRIEPYTPWDILTLVLPFPVLWLLCTWVYRRLVPASDSERTLGHPLFPLTGVDWRPVMILAAIMFAAWLPYLLAYWPGLVFGDSVRSINQVLGGEDLSNHDPVLYTLFVGACLNAGQALFGDHTAGVAIYSIAQMATMAACLAYLSVWIVSHLGLKRWWLVVFVILFAGTPYIAEYSIAMWKDPLFSCALVMLTLCLANLIIDLESGVELHARPWSLGLCALAVVFTRNNGLFICLVVAVVLAVVLVAHGAVQLRPYLRVSASCLSWVILAAAIALGYVITGPVFSALGYNTESTVESAGVLVSQMARVAATDGVMTSSDEEYLDELYPIEDYARDYPPSCIDTLKWSPNFDEDVLDDDLIGHWLALGVENPLTYLEAWELQTAGFWTFGYDGFSTDNVMVGVPYNLTDNVGAGHEEGDVGEPSTESSAQGAGGADRPQTAKALKSRYGINLQGLLPAELRGALVADEWSVPAGWILWLMVFALICLAGSQRLSWALVLVPGLALMATLVLASPIIYWPRYALACQLLLPFFACLLARIRTRT